MTIDLGIAVALLIFLPLVIAGSYFVFYNYRGYDSRHVQSESLEQCPFCTHIFYAPLGEAIWMCPRCKSLLHPKEEAGSKKDTYEH